jgi:hypothetical protein
MPQRTSERAHSCSLCGLWASFRFLGCPMTRHSFESAFWTRKTDINAAMLIRRADVISVMTIVAATVGSWLGMMERAGGTRVPAS